MSKFFKFLLSVIFIGIVTFGVILLITLVTGDSKDNEESKEDVNSGIVKEEEQDENASTAALSYSNVVSVSGSTVDLYIKNPGKSNKKIKVEVIALEDSKEVVIAKSGIVESGYAIYDLELIKDGIIDEGKYDGYFKITYYNDETSDEEIVNTKIDIKITVR